MLIISLPNILNNSKILAPIELDGQAFTMSLEWLDDYCLFALYKTDNGKEVFVVKPRAMTINSDLIGRVKDPDLITGKLYLLNRFGIDIEPVQSNLHPDYNLVWVSENE